MRNHSIPDWCAPALAWALFASELISSRISGGEIHLNFFARTLAVFAVAWTAGYLAMRRLWTHHVEVWEEMDRPKLFGSPWCASTWSLARYMWTFRFLELRDGTLSAAFIAFMVLTAVAVFMVFGGR